ncbi:MAG: hypothetical protein FWD48_11155 [Oscillospiraceae bacterium]|nr:hypothetical protein [Oscillospiraceae bacterium]
MGSIVIKLNPEKLTNPDLDLRYVVPDTISELTQGKIINEGFDYLDDECSTMVILLSSSNPREDVVTVAEIIKNNSFMDNQLNEAAEILFSDKPDDELFANPHDIQLFLSLHERYEK